MRASVSGAGGLALAYAILTVGVLVAWFTIDLSSPRGLLHGVLITAAGALSAVLAWQLWWTANSGAQRVGRAWVAVKDDGAPAAQSSGRADEKQQRSERPG